MSWVASTRDKASLFEILSNDTQRQNKCHSTRAGCRGEALVNGGLLEEIKLGDRLQNKKKAEVIPEETPRESKVKMSPGGDWQAAGRNT